MGTPVQSGKDQLKQWRWPERCLNRVFPMIEVYVTDEDTSEGIWVEAEPIGRILNKDGFDAFLSVEYLWDGEYYTEDFGPRRVRYRGQFETVYELLDESGFVDDETDLPEDSSDEDSCDDLLCGNCEPSITTNAWQRSGHWVCEHGTFLLAHQECRCLEDDADELLMQDIIDSRSAEQVQATASNGSADCGHAQVQQSASTERHADDKVEQYVAQQTQSTDIASKCDVTEGYAHSGNTGTSPSQRWPSLWWSSNSAKRTSRADWQLPRDCDKSQSKIVGIASAPVRMIMSGIDAFGWTEPKSSGMFVSTSSVEAAMPVGDEAV